MARLQEDRPDADEVVPGPFRVTPGFIAFVTALIMFGLSFAWALIYNNFG